MPEGHQQYLKWDGARFVQWAEKIGPSTATTVRSILSAHKIEQQGYRSCMGLLKLADRYSVERLENACTRALSFTPQPSFKSVKNILITGQDKLEPAIGELTAQYGKIGGNLNQIARTLNEWHSPYPAMAKELKDAAADIAVLKYEVLQKVGEAIGDTQTYQL